MIGNVLGTAVAHSRTQATHVLVNNLLQHAFVSHTAFDAFGNIFFYVGFGILEVAVAAAGGHGTQ